VASVTGNPAVAAGSAIVDHHAAKAARDSVLVVLGGQVERALGLFTTFALRWGLDPARLGVYTGLRLYLDNTNRSSLGVGLGAVQEIPALRAAGRHDEAARIANVAHTANTITCGLYVAGLIAWAVIRLPLLRGDSLAAEWTWGLIAVAALAIVQRYLSFLIAVLRSHQEFGITTSVDIVEAVASAVLILWRVPDGERAVGLYSVALLGTSWGLDVAGRVVTVLYPYFQVALSHARDRAEVPRRALQATEAQAALLAALAAWAYLVGPAALGMLLPRYAEGLPALRPLLPGMFLLGLAWPSRQMLIAVGQPYRLCAGTLAALPIAIGLGILGADRAGIVGVAWAMSAGYAIVFLITSATATVPDLGFGAWLAHLGRLAIPALWFALGAAGVDLLIPISSDWQIWIPRIVSLAVWTLLAVYAWMRRRPRHGLISSRTESC
jgi:O-antigen/teichoic acid export membrane protein